ncbi:MAG: radical SAM protein [Gemmatimonadota bacterium]
MPLGLACVAETTREAGHAVSMIDLMFEMDAEAVLEQAIIESRPDCIGISVRNIDDQNFENPNFLLKKVKEVVTACREMSGAPIVLGGAGYSMFPESALAWLDAEIGIRGEGEVAFPALLAGLEKRSDISGIPGLHFQGRGPGPTQTPAMNLDALPLPDTGLLDASAAGNQDPWIPVQTRRGCPLKCSYCSTPAIEGTRLRKRSPEHVANWLESLARAGYENFFFVDNTFNLPPSYAKELCRRIVAKGLQIRWRSIIYPKTVDQELVELMAAAGCRQISLGFESGCDRILNNMNKRFSTRDVQAISTLFADHGIERMGFLLLGSPGETRDSVDQSLDFADSLDLNALRLSAGVRIYPETELADVARQQGVISPQDDLLLPRFYLSRNLEGWLIERLHQWRSSRPHVIM